MSIVVSLSTVSTTVHFNTVVRVYCCTGSVYYCITSLVPVYPNTVHGHCTTVVLDTSNSVYCIVTLMEYTVQCIANLHIFLSCCLSCVGMLRFPIQLEDVLGFRGRIHRHILNDDHNVWEEAAVQVGMTVGSARFTLDVHVPGLSA